MRDEPGLADRAWLSTVLLAAALFAASAPAAAQWPEPEAPSRTIEGEVGELRTCPQGVGDGTTVVRRADADLGRVLRVGHIDCQVAYTAPLSWGDVDSVRFAMTGNGGADVCGRWDVFVDLHLVGSSDAVCAASGALVTADLPDGVSVPGRGYRLAWVPVAPSPEWANGLLDSFEITETAGITTIEGETGDSEGLPCSGEGAQVISSADASGGEALRLGHDGCHARYTLDDNAFVRGVRLAVSGLGGEDVCARVEVLDKGAITGWTRTGCLKPGEFIIAPMHDVVTVSPGDFEVHWRTTDSPPHANVIIDAIYLDGMPDLVRLEGEGGAPGACDPPTVAHDRHESSGGGRVMTFGSAGCRAAFELPEGTWYVRTVRWVVEQDVVGECTWWNVWEDNVSVGGTPQLCPQSAGQWHIAAPPWDIELDGAFEMEWRGPVAGTLDYVELSAERPTP